jgi:hypothetical protein
MDDGSEPEAHRLPLGALGMSASVIARLTSARIVPVVEIADADYGVALARTLAGAGLPMMEVTLRTPAALDAIRAIASEVPDFLVGAGTLLTTRQLEDAVAAGAHFGVSPGFSAALSGAAVAAELPFVPGATTATEILAAATSSSFLPSSQAAPPRSPRSPRHSRHWASASCRPGASAPRISTRTSPCRASSQSAARGSRRATLSPRASSR